MTTDATPTLDGHCAKVLHFRLRNVVPRPFGQEPPRQPCAATVEAAYHLYRRALSGDIQGLAFALVDDSQGGRLNRYATGKCTRERNKDTVQELALLQGALLRGEQQ